MSFIRKLATSLFVPSFTGASKAPLLTRVPSQGFSEIWKKKKNVIIKPFTVSSSNTIFSVTPVKGKYGSKSDYITVIKNGCVLTELIPSSLDSSGKVQVDYSSRMYFALNLQNIGQILAISDEAIAHSKIDTTIEYSLSTTIKKKIMTIKKDKESQQFIIDLVEKTQGVEDDQWSEQSLSSTIPVSDFIVFRELCRFTMPYLVGWQALASYDFAEKDSTDERI